MAARIAAAAVLVAAAAASLVAAASAGNVYAPALLLLLAAALKTLLFLRGCVDAEVPWWKQRVSRLRKHVLFASPYSWARSPARAHAREDAVHDRHPSACPT